MYTPRTMVLAKPNNAQSNRVHITLFQNVTAKQWYRLFEAYHLPMSFPSTFRSDACCWGGEWNAIKILHSCTRCIRFHDSCHSLVHPMRYSSLFNDMCYFGISTVDVKNGAGYNERKRNWVWKSTDEDTCFVSWVWWICHFVTLSIFYD